MKLGCWGWWTLFWFVAAFANSYSHTHDFISSGIDGLFSMLLWSLIPWLIYKGLMGIANLFGGKKHSGEDEQSE